MTADPESVLVFDIGGSHLSAASYCHSARDCSPPLRIPLPALSSPQDFVDALAAAAACVSLPLPPSAIAIAIAGPFDYARGISLMQHKLPVLYRFDLRVALSSAFSLPAHRICFLNDAEAFLSGEIAAGAAKGSQRTIGLTLGTGIGSAFAIDGRIVASRADPDGWQEIWDLPYRGVTVEDLLSTQALISSYAAFTGDQLSVHQIAARAPSDPQALAAFATFGTHLGAVLRDLIFPFDPDCVVIGGGISRASIWFMPAALQQLNGLQTRVHLSALLDRAPLLGAGVRWFKSER